VWDFGNQIPSTTSEISTPVIEIVDAATFSDETNPHTKMSAPSTLLDNNETRGAFLNELLELKGFLTQRLSELESTEKVPINFDQSGASTLKKTSSTSIKNWIKAVTDILASIENPKVKLLLEIRNSKRYVDRLTASYQHLIECEEKFNNSLIYAKNKKEELNQNIADQYPQQEQITNNAKKIKNRDC